jgi:GTP:adenosylcobinamide-phosphate guanylyltransferase
MAARRPGSLDPLVEMTGVSHKCMIPINGKPLLDRVVDSLLKSGSIQKIYISIDDGKVVHSSQFLSELIDKGIVVITPAEANLADSVLASARDIPEQEWPIIITTGDNALHTPEIIADFVRGIEQEDSDVALGITREEDVAPTIPDSGLAYHRLKDGGFSSCNLYAIHHNALDTVNIFRSGGQFGKKHWRILKSFGLTSFLLYKLKLLTINGLIRRIGRGFGIKVIPVFLPYDYGPIDVDNPFSFKLSERLLKEREKGST